MRKLEGAEGHRVPVRAGSCGILGAGGRGGVVRELRGAGELPNCRQELLPADVLEQRRIGPRRQADWDM